MLARGHNFVLQDAVEPVSCFFFFFYCTFIQKDTGNFDIYFDYCVRRLCNTHFF